MAAVLRMNKLDIADSKRAPWRRGFVAGHANAMLVVYCLCLLELLFGKFKT
jgi:hypothetical protein